MNSGPDERLQELERAAWAEPERLELAAELERRWRQSRRLIAGRSLEYWLADLSGNEAQCRAAIEVLAPLGPLPLVGAIKAFETGAPGARRLLRRLGPRAIPALDALLKQIGRPRAYEALALLRELVAEPANLLELALDMARNGDRVRRTLAFSIFEECGPALEPHLYEITSFLDPSNRFEVSWLVNKARDFLGWDLLENAHRYAPFTQTPALRRAFVEVAFAAAVRERCFVPSEAIQVFLEELPLAQWSRFRDRPQELDRLLSELLERSPEIIARRGEALGIRGLEILKQARELGEPGRKTLIALLASENSWVREAALSCLGGMSGCDETRAAVESLQNDEQHIVRQRANELVARWRGEAPPSSRQRWD